MQDLLGAECDLAEILCVYSLHKNLSGLSEGIYRIGLICGGGGCERACKCAARRAGAASVEFDRNLCGSIFYAIFNHIYAILARLERKRCGFKMSVRGVSEFHRAIFLLGSPIRLRFGVLIFCLKLRWASPRNFSQKRPPVPTSRSSHSPRACIPRLRQAKCKAQQILRCRLLLLFDLTVIHL